MRLSFDSVEEVRAFVKNDLKGTRAGKGGSDTDDSGAAQVGTPGVGGGSPAPLQPPQGAGGFPGAGVTMGSAFPTTTGPAPEVTALVQRINTRIDGAIQSGQAPDQILGWFRGQCGPEAASATMDQIKTVFLPKAAVPTLENIAKLMNA